MTFINIDAINRNTSNIGEEVTITHYRGDQTYNADQNPTKPFKTIKTKAAISNPTKLDIDNGFGKITIHDKKFMFKESIDDISLGDNIKIDATSENFKVKQVNTHRFAANEINKTAFASGVI